MARAEPEDEGEPASRTAQSQPGEPWFALPLSDLQAIQTTYSGR